MSESGQKAQQLFADLENVEEQNFADILQNNIDQNLIPVFAEYAQNIFTEVDEEVLSGLVHLMVMAYLVKTNEIQPLIQPAS